MKTLREIVLLVFHGETFAVRFLVAAFCWGLPALLFNGMRYDQGEFAWRWPGLLGPLLEAFLLAGVAPLFADKLKRKPPRS